MSKFNSSRSKNWNPKTSQRFNKSTTDVPGAGTYYPNSEMSDEGKYVLSKSKGDGKRRFSIGFRNSFFDTPAKITKSTNYLIQPLALAVTDNHLTLVSMTISAL